MKTFFVSFFALFALFIGVFSAPTQAGSQALDRRESAEDALAVVQSLYATVQEYTAVINATTDGLSSDSTDVEKAAAGVTITDAIASINSAVVEATSEISSSSKTKRSALSRRQADELETLLVTLLTDISGALNNVISGLGLTATLSFLGPLVSSLSGLLLALDAVVDQLLAVVQQLVDGLLIGLSAALAGLVL